MRRSDSLRLLPQALTATVAVVGLPVVAVSVLSASGALTGFLPLLAASMALSLAASSLGSAIWARQRGGGDTVFADLMLWGWLRRWRAERQLASAVRLLGLRRAPTDPPAELSADRRVRLLARLAASLEARRPETHGHSRRVARHAAAIAARMGLAPEEVARIRAAASVHDVGKVHLPDEIVDKPAALTDAEFEVVKRHAEIGAAMVSGLDDEELTGIVRHHHERIDGTGYPAGLAGGEIPIGARVVAVADTFDAIASERPYRSARRHREALAVLEEEAGGQLDPDAVRAFRSYYSGLRPVALWAFVLNGPRQLLASLGAELKAGKVAVAAQASAATAATVAAGTVAVHVGDAADPGARPAAAAAQPAALVSSPAGGGPQSDEPRRSADGSAGGRDGSHPPTAATGSERTLAATAGEQPASDAGAGASPGERDRTTGSGGEGAGSGPDSDGSQPAPTRTVSKAIEPVTSTVDSAETTVEGTVKDTVTKTTDSVAETTDSALPDVPAGRR